MKQIALTFVGLVAVLVLAGAAAAESYTASTAGDWSAAGTWTPAKSGGPGAGDGAYLSAAVTCDVANGSVDWMFVSLGGSLTVTDGNALTFGGDGNNTIEIHNSNVFNLVGAGRIVYTGGAMHFRDGSVNTIDFANNPTDGKVSVSTNMILSVGDDGSTVTLNIGAGSNGAHFGGPGGGENGLLSVTAATIGFDGWDGGNKISGANGAVINIDSYAAVYTPNAITLDNTSKLNIGGDSLGFLVRTPTLNITGASVTTDGTLSNDSGAALQLNVIQNASQKGGMTLNAGLALYTGDVMKLFFDSGTPTGALSGDPASFDWALRWKGNHVEDLQSMLADKMLDVDAPGTFSPTDNIYYASDGYTYVGFVPEPATMSLLAIGGLAALLKRRRNV